MGKGDWGGKKGENFSVGIRIKATGGIKGRRARKEIPGGSLPGPTNRKTKPINMTQNQVNQNLLEEGNREKTVNQVMTMEARETFWTWTIENRKGGREKENVMWNVAGGHKWIGDISKREIGNTKCQRNQNRKD